MKDIKEDLVTLRLFSPLAANCYPYGEWGELLDYQEEVTPEELCACEDEILKMIAKEQLEGERGLAIYLPDEQLQQKVFSMKPTVESWQGELWGVLEVKSHGILSPEELATLTEEWSGQESDGWGESFEQRSIKTDAGELYISFWHQGNDFVILPEQEVKKQSTNQMFMQRGGM